MVFTLTIVAVIVSLFSFASPSVLVPCPNNYDIGFDAGCLATGKRTCTNETMKIAWDYVNLDKGKVNISILGQSCLPKNYNLRLNRFNSYNEDSCNDTSKEIILTKCIGKSCGKQQTKNLSYRAVSENVGIPCEQVQNVTFDFIYTGQYILYVCHVTDTRIYYSNPVCFKTNFKKESMFNQEITIVSQYIQDRKLMQHTVSNFSRLQVNKLSLYVVQKGQDSSVYNGTISSLNVAFKGSRIQCLNNTRNVCELQYDQKEDLLTCTMKNVTRGNQSLYVSLAHDPCREHSNVWKDGVLYCNMNGTPVTADLEIATVESDPTETAPKEPTINTKALAVLIILCLVFAIVIAIFAKFLFNRWCKEDSGIDPELKKTGSYASLVDIPLSAVEPQLYLAYARDCPAFMEIMVIFRNMLKRLNFKVYDCFDHDCMEEISRIGSSWPGKYISNANVKVLFIETRCAKLHYQAHLENMKLAYQNPTAWDNYFMFSLKSLLSRQENHSYHRVFMSRVSGFTTDEDMLSEITPYTRYNIPDAMNHLICSLRQQNGLTFPENWSNDIVRLQEAAKNLVNYKTSNQNYLNELLVRTEINKFKRFFSKFRYQ